MYILRIILEIIHFKVNTVARDMEEIFKIHLRKAKFLILHAFDKTIPETRLRPWQVYFIIKCICFNHCIIFLSKIIYCSAWYVLDKSITKQKPCLVINWLRKIRHHQGPIFKILSILPKDLMCFLWCTTIWEKKEI